MKQETKKINKSVSFCTQVWCDINVQNNVNTYACNKEKIDWILDSGCSDHIINHETYFNESI